MPRVIQPGLQVTAPSGVLALLEANVNKNRKLAAANGGEMKIRAIDWGNWSRSDIPHQELDWIVGSDLTYDRRYWNVLLSTIVQLSTPQTRVQPVPAEFRIVPPPAAESP